MKRSATALLSSIALLGFAGCSDPVSTKETASDPNLFWSGGNGSGGSGPFQAVSYINPDIGAASFNPDVNQNSSCNYPDQNDTQKLSDPGTTNRNVHNDACLFGSSGGGWNGGYSNFDGPATFDASGVGVISACPDPDNAGPKFAVLSDRNGDGRADRCFQSGYQSKGTAGDREFHVRLNNTSMPGQQSVTFCSDPQQNGCSDTYVRSSISINWVP